MYFCFRKGKKIKEGSSKLTSESETMVFDEVQSNKPHTTKQFRFGQSKQGKSFCTSKMWHTQSAKQKDKGPKEISTSELMDTLPN